MEGPIGFSVAHVLVLPDAAGEDGVGVHRNGHCTSLTPKQCKNWRFPVFRKLKHLSLEEHLIGHLKIGKDDLENK